MGEIGNVTKLTKLVLISFASIMLLTGSLAITNNQSAIAATGNCNDPPHPKVNWSGCDLHGKWDLQVVNLAYANLKGANLWGANIQRSNLTGANLEGAYLGSTIFEGAILRAAHLHGAHLQYAELAHVDLTYADLSSANLTGAYMAEANLSHANIQKADMENANLAGVNLFDTKTNGTNLKGATVYLAHLNGIKLSSPIKQIEYGMSYNEVKCSIGLVLLKKSTKDSFACVKPITVHKFLKRNWVLVDKSIITLTVGQTKGPLLVQEIYPDRVVGTQFRAGPIGVSSGPITLHLGESVGDYSCSGILFLITIQDKNATFSYQGEGLGVCPICLSGDTYIDTPNGPVNIKQLKDGMSVWTLDNLGHKQPAIILKIGKTLVPSTHIMLHIVLDDGRELFASAGHPTADGRLLGDLTKGDILDNSRVKSIEHVAYNETYTYDILPSGSTGFYWANEILMGSTLKQGNYLHLFVKAW